MSLREAAREALSIKCDVECHQALIKLRRECREKGIDPDRVNKIIRSVNHESSRDKQHAEPAPKPESPTEGVQPVTTEAPKVDVNQGAESGLRSRTQESLPTVSGLTPSGTRKTGASGGKSIVDGIL